MGLEIVVRPNIPFGKRPQPRRLPQSDDEPVSFDGGSGQVIDETHSRTYSYSKTRERETRRIFDTLRIYQKEGEEINQQNYVDVEVVRGLQTVDAKGKINKYKFEKHPPRDNIEVVESLQTRDSCLT